MGPKEPKPEKDLAQATEPVAGETKSVEQAQITEGAMNDSPRAGRDQ
jgi:hypothetical protein